MKNGVEFKDLSKDELDNELQWFLHSELKALLDGFLGYECGEAALDLPRASEDHSITGGPDGKFLLQEFFDVVYDFAKYGTWKGGDHWETLFQYGLFVDFAFPEFFDLGVETSSREGHRLVYEAICARLALYPEVFDLEGISPLTYGRHVQRGYLTRRQLAIVASLNEETVRGAAYQEGDQKLCLSSNGYVAAEEARRWLSVKGRYSPYRLDIEIEYEPKERTSSIVELKMFIERRMEAQELIWVDIEACVDKGTRESLSRFTAGKRHIKALEWLTPEAAIEIGKVLHLSPSWLAESAINARAELHRQLARREIEQLSAQVLAEEQAFVIDKLMAINPASIRDSLIECGWVSRHPAQTKPNQKMDGYVPSRGRVFTHQHEQKKQYLWVESELVSEHRKSLITKQYPAADVNRDGVYGRHSGLKKYREISEASLDRIQIRNGEDLELVLSILK